MQINQNFILKEIKGQKFNKMFKQLDMIIINFGKPIVSSLHIASAVRVCQNEKIILNVSDEFFTKSGNPKSEKQYKLINTKGLINDPNSLFAKNVAIVNRLLKNKQIIKVKRTKWHDLILFFEDNVEVQIMQDCLQKDFEYYRYIKFEPFYHDDFSKCKSSHYVVKNKQSVPVLEKEQ